MEKLYLVDGNAYIHRAYHAMPPLTNPKGQQVNAVFGFVKMLLKLIKNEKPKHLIVCFDYPAKNFRHTEYAEYKANRKELEEDLKSQMPMAREAVKALNIPHIEVEGFEADDLIATLAKSAERDNAEVVIVTGDKDAFQLVNDKIKIFNEQKNILYDAVKVEEKYGLKPEQMSDMFALMGDASDNVPGVEGIGEKTAVKLIKEYGSLEKLLQNADKISGKVGESLRKNREDAVKSKSLVLLNENVPLKFKWQECILQVDNSVSELAYFKEMGFNSLIKDMVAKTNITPSPQSSPSKGEEARRAGEGDGCFLKSSIKTNIITDIDELKTLVSVIKKNSMLSIDTETNSLDTFNAVIAGISIAVDVNEGYYIPINHNYLGCPEQIPYKNIIEELKSVLEDNKIRKYGHNIKFDCMVLNKHGIKMQGIYFDTMIASYCLNPSRNSHGLKNLSIEVLNEEMTRIEELIGKGKNQQTIDMIEIEKVAPYAVCDAVNVLKLADIFSKELKDKKLEDLFYKLEMPVIEVLADMEENGIKIDIPYFKNLSNEYSKNIESIEKDVYKIAGEEFNLNSPKQLAVILFEKLKLPVVRKTKTGYSTDEDVLNTLSVQHELPKELLKYRELQKLKSTYIDAMLVLGDKSSRVHTSFNQAVAQTGRLSSSEPNLQNIPIKSEYGKGIRKGFIAEEHKVLISFDYSQIDLRSMAHISKDPVLINAFNKGEDIHTTTAKEVFGDVNPDLRRIAKTINFGIIYGQSAFGLAGQLGISNTQAREYIESYFAKYSGVKQWMGDIVEYAKKHGYVSTLLGRVRYIPEINAKNGNLRGFAERTAMNTPIQGTSADIIKQAMINVYNEFKGKVSIKMLLQVHDELLFESDEKYAAEAVPIIKKIMESAVKLDVPLIVDVKIGKNWMDMEKIK